MSGVDVAFDTVGGETTQSLVPTLREGGILVTIANAPPEEAARERGARAELLVTSPSSEQLARIAELVAAGDVHVEISEVLPLDRGPARPRAQRVRAHARQDRPDGEDLTKAAQGWPRYSVGSSASPATRSAPAMPRGPSGPHPQRVQHAREHERSDQRDDGVAPGEVDGERHRDRRRPEQARQPQQPFALGAEQPRHREQAAEEGDEDGDGVEEDEPLLATGGSDEITAETARKTTTPQ